MKRWSNNAVIALCGPSGVGKGTTKRKVLEALGPVFAEPVVATTRTARPDDGPCRMTGLSEEIFEAAIASGEIVLAHRPFRHPDTPYYGFSRASLAVQSPILTEVHSSILPEFSSYFTDRPLLVLGLVAAKETLLANLDGRAGSLQDSIGTSTRTNMAWQEVQEIQAGYEAGFVSEIISCEPQERDEAQEYITSIVGGLIGEYVWQNKPHHL